MRRARQHRLTGSGRRLLGAATLAGVGAALAVTMAAGTASASGIGLGLDLGALGSVSLNLPTFTVPIPSPRAPSTSSLPGTSLPAVCPTGCAASGPGGGGNGNHGGSSPPGGRGRSVPAAGVRHGDAPGSASSSGSSASAELSVPRSVAGLSVSPPPPVEALTPLAGISFGQAPYLWPLLLCLDALALAGVVMLVRWTWSTKPGAH